MSHPTFMPSTGRIFVICFAICMLVAGISLRAQEGRASINGTVTDQSGGPVLIRHTRTYVPSIVTLSEPSPAVHSGSVKDASLNCSILS